ncbi:hypothetical protein ACJZ2D_006319 [Fusarium nematophilum]
MRPRCSPRARIWVSGHGTGLSHSALSVHGSRLDAILSSLCALPPLSPLLPPPQSSRPLPSTVAASPHRSTQRSSLDQPLCMSLNTEETITVSRIRRPRREYRCRHCSKVFKRSEHCIRHERSHTREKPFSCQYCFKTYSRKDLVTRHERTLHADRSRRDLCHEQPARHPSPPDALSEGTPGEESPDSSDEDGHNQTITAQVPLTPQDSFETPPANGGTDPFNEYLWLAPETVAEIGESLPNEGPLASLVDTIRLPTPRHDLVASFQVDLDVTQEGDDGEGSTSGVVQPAATDQQTHRVGKGLALEESDRQLGIMTQLHPRITDPSSKLHHVEASPSDMTNFLVPFLNNPSPQNWTAEARPGSGPSAADVWRDLQLGGQLPDNVLEPSLWCPESRPVETILSPPERELPSLSLMQDTPHSFQALIIDRDTHLAIQHDLAHRLQKDNFPSQFPSAKLCQNLLSSYTECFHSHLPIIHLPTFDLNKVPSPLTISMCCIGALYRLDRRRARQLYELAAEGVESAMAPSRSSIPPTKDCPLWLVQSKMLLSIYSLLGGDSDLASHAMEGNGFFSVIYKRTRVLLTESAKDLASLSWPDWVERESWKRMLGGLYITSTLTMVIYDVNPGFTVTQDLELETFDDEPLWNARTPGEWRELRSKQPAYHDRQMKHVLEDVISEGNPRPLDYSLTPFSALLLMHAVVVHMWQRLQVLQTFPSLSSDPVSVDGTLGSWLLTSSLKALTRCQRLLQGGRDQHQHQQESDDDSDNPLVFNCQAILRIAHIRLFNVTSAFNRMCLITTDPGVIEASAASYVAAKLDRSSQLLSAVTKAFEGLRIPVKMGHMLIRKTAALRWSVEHAVSGWDSALFVTKWVHSVEIDKLNGIPASDAEEGFLANIRDILEEADYDLDESKSLAAGVARTWGLFLQDVWVWGITPRMGAILDQLAMAYERVDNDNRRGKEAGE